MKQQVCQKITFSRDVFGIAHPLIGHFQTEHTIVLLLNTKGGLVKTVQIASGLPNVCRFRLKDVMFDASKFGVVATILCHNHPSPYGSEPSEDDIKTTAIIREVWRRQKVLMLDHVIIARDSYFSFFDNKMLPKGFSFYRKSER
ncbi:MAG: JAB domain-containing protein [Patescibacteria group bacterium]|nr:JAB domain-containing protein [Patescibacteria group bacterium]